MNQQEQHALRKIMDEIGEVYVHGPAYDESFRRTSDGDPVSLMNDPSYRLGFERCAERARTLLSVLFAPRSAMIRYAGRPPKKRKP